MARLAHRREDRRTFAYSAVLLLATLFASPSLRAQTVCDFGNQPLSPAQPSGIAPADIIQAFAAKESTFKAARDRYTYTLDVTIDTLLVSGRPDGEYHQVSEITPGNNGALAERVTFAPQNTLRRITLTPDDLDDVRLRLSSALSAEELPLLSVVYAGRQHVDMLDTYVFDVSPKNARSDKKLFTGRIWVDDQDLVIVKTCDKPHPDEKARGSPIGIGKSAARLTPIFVTYREEIAGQFWFATYAKADEVLPFPRELSTCARSSATPTTNPCLSNKGSPK